MFSFLKRKKTFFNSEEQELIVSAIRNAERCTSGEVRVFVESRCSYMDALDRAIEIFGQMGMQATLERNAVLVYVAIKDKQLAVFGDEGIHQKVGPDYWNTEVIKMTRDFNRDNYALGIAGCVEDIGQALQEYFPYTDKDINELPDDIHFGR
ncbi:MAG TPA: TPM domain-containing protein [Chitinophagaceae bacterium]|nr:TPM domain-containing protein [Chitinophagaceae bacterium]